MAIEVSDGFGIVLRAIRFNHQTFAMYDIVTKYSALSKIPTNKPKISVNTHLSLTIWRQNGATNKGAKRKKGHNSLELRPGNYLFCLTIWLRGRI